MIRIMAAPVSLPATSSQLPLRSLIIGLVVVLTVVGSVFAVRSIPRWQWESHCRDTGGRVVSHAGGHEPYLAHGSQISYTCEGSDGVISTWP